MRKSQGAVTRGMVGGAAGDDGDAVQRAREQALEHPRLLSHLGRHERARLAHYGSDRRTRPP